MCCVTSGDRSPCAGREAALHHRRRLLHDPRARRGRDAITWVGLEYRYMPPIARLIDEVAAGAVGIPKMISIREHRFPFLEKVGDWNRFSENTGNARREVLPLLRPDGADHAGPPGARDGLRCAGRQPPRRGLRRPSPRHSRQRLRHRRLRRRRSRLLDLCMFAEATHNQEELSVVGPLGKVEALIPEDIVRIGRRGNTGSVASTFTRSRTTKSPTRATTRVRAGSSTRSSATPCSASLPPR